MAQMFPRRWVWGIVVAIALVLPHVCLAQGAGSFGDMPNNLKPGQIAIVTDTSGRQTQGKVAEVTTSSLIILERDANRAWTLQRTFEPGGVREVKRTGPIWDKALWGLGAGFLVGVLSGADCTGCLDGGALGLMFGGIGGGIGLGIDAAIGPKRVYLAPASDRQAGLAPLFDHSRSSVALTLSF